MVETYPNKIYSILHVDDDSGICNVVKRRLSRLKYNVITAQSGTEALTLLEGNEIHLAILDVSMPGMNGYQLAERLRARLPGLPLVLLTGFRDDRNINLSLELGCQSLIEKPFLFETLEFSIERLLKAAAARNPESLRP